MQQYLPYYRHLRAVKWPFLLGVSCGLVYALASGIGLPLMTKVVFPVLFRAPANVIAEFPQFASVEEYDDLRREFIKGSPRDLTF